MITCGRCGDRVPRLTASQTHCVPCGAQVAAIIAADERRRQPRFPIGKDLTGAVAL